MAAVAGSLSLWNSAVLSCVLQINCDCVPHLLPTLQREDGATEIVALEAIPCPHNPKHCLQHWQTFCNVVPPRRPRPQPVSTQRPQPVYGCPHWSLAQMSPTQVCFICPLECSAQGQWAICASGHELPFSACQPVHGRHAHLANIPLQGRHSLFGHAPQTQPQVHMQPREMLLEQHQDYSRRSSLGSKLRLTSVSEIWCWLPAP